MLVDGKRSFRMCCECNIQSVKWKGGSWMQKIGSGGKQLKKGKLWSILLGVVSVKLLGQGPNLSCGVNVVHHLWHFVKIEGELLVPDVILHMTTFICKAGQWCSSQVHSCEKCNKATRQQATCTLVCRVKNNSCHHTKPGWSCSLDFEEPWCVKTIEEQFFLGFSGPVLVPGSSIHKHPLQLPFSCT